VHQMRSVFASLAMFDVAFGSNECNPAVAAGCNVCAACCKAYIPDGAACDTCVTKECGPTPSPGTVLVNFATDSADGSCSAGSTTCNFRAALLACEPPACTVLFPDITSVLDTDAFGPLDPPPAVSNLTLSAADTSSSGPRPVLSGPLNLYWQYVNASLTLVHLEFHDVGFSVSGAHSPDFVSVVNDCAFIGGTTSTTYTPIVSGGAVRVTDGYFQGNRASYSSMGPARGGCIYAYYGINATRTEFHGGNYVAADMGGALYSEGYVNVDGCTFDDLQVDDPGGAIYATADVTVKNSAFSNCTGAPGGAIIGAGSVTVASSSFDNCTSSSPGGAVYAAAMMATNTTFTRCTGGIDNGSPGGAIYCDKTATLVDTKFDGCMAGFGGGAVFASTVQATRSSFQNCSSSNGGNDINGGAVHVDNPRSFFVDCSFENCRASGPGSGGAVFGGGQFTGCSFVANEAISPASANECNPSAEGGCNVCDACCKV
jgi:hypothetical protein